MLFIIINLYSPQRQKTDKSETQNDKMTKRRGK